MKWLGQSEQDPQLWVCLVAKVKAHAVKNNVAEGLQIPRSYKTQRWRDSQSRQSFTHKPNVVNHLAPVVHLLPALGSKELRVMSSEQNVSLF